MNRPKTRHEQLCDLIVEAGFETGWVLVGEMLTLWEHDENPPQPLKKPVVNNNE